MTAADLKAAAEACIAARRDEYKRKADQAHAAQAYPLEQEYRHCAAALSEAILLVADLKVK